MNRDCSKENQTKIYKIIQAHYTFLHTSGNRYMKQNYMVIIIYVVEKKVRLVRLD